MSVKCPQCGAPLERGAKTCPRCRAPLAGGRKGRERLKSLLWIIIPTLIYAYLSRNLVTTAILAVLGAGLAYAQTRKEVPAVVRPFMPLLQVVLTFVFLGGSPIAVALVAAAIAAVIWQGRLLIRVLEPWWQVQGHIPLLVRRVVGFILAFVIGYYFAGRAGGREWTYTLLSVACGTAVMFLLTFTPPAAMRKTA